MMDENELTGIARHGHHLGYTLNHGFTFGPSWLKHGIVAVWNFTSCVLFGHDELVRDKPNGPVICVSCLREVTQYNPKNVWEAY